jgi:hypothetical protein
MRTLTTEELDKVAGAVGTDLSSGYGTVTAQQHGALESTPYPFTPGTVVPSQAAASYYNPSFVADGLYTAGSGNPRGNVGNS